MRLRANRPMRVTVPELGLDLDFALGEDIRTEISAKFRDHRVRDELSAAGFAAEDRWLDEAGDFALWLAKAV